MVAGKGVTAAYPTSGGGCTDCRPSAINLGQRGGVGGSERRPVVSSARCNSASLPLCRGTEQPEKPDMRTELLIADRDVDTNVKDGFRI